MCIKDRLRGFLFLRNERWDARCNRLWQAARELSGAAVPGVKNKHFK